VLTHLARNPESRQQGAITLVRQAAQLMSRLTSFASRHEHKPDVPYIVAGDFNAELIQQIRAVIAAFHTLRHDDPTPPSTSRGFTLLRQLRIDNLMHSEMFLRLERAPIPSNLVGQHNETE
jgi:endonuclease/exonuclease/phosphatase family metal-dependent hydrolase